MVNLIFKRSLLIAMCLAANVCFAETTPASKNSLSKASANKTSAGYKSPERIITNEAEYAEMVRDYERQRAQSSIKSKTATKTHLAVSSSSSRAKSSR